MKFIGITGGVGAGKSAILDYLRKKDHIRVMLADEIAHKLMEPGTACFQRLEQKFKDADIFLQEGGFDREKVATFIFGEEEKRLAFNGIVHPAVKEYVIEQYEKDGTLLVFRPELDSISKFEKDKEKQEAFYQNGYTLTEANLQKIKDFMA